MLATELPRSDKANLAPLAEYEKIDGFHDKPRGQDVILDQMQEEEKEFGAGAGSPEKLSNLDKLKAIEDARQQ